MRTESLPAYFQPESQPSRPGPGASEVRIPLTLPIGDNHANLYLGFGDSITYGDGSSDRQGYVIKLQNLLGPHFGPRRGARVGTARTVSVEGARKTRETLRWYDPAYVLILYGTNDWHDQRCQGKPPPSCYTIEALRDIDPGHEGLGQPAGAGHDPAGEPRAARRRAATSGTTT